MDLINLKPTSDTVEVALVHPNTGAALKNDDKTPMTITVYASHSKEHKAVLHEQTNKRLKAMQSGKKQDFTAQDIEEATLTLLSKITADWNITYGGEKPKFSVKKAKEVYSRFLWLPDFIIEEVDKREDFTKA